MATPKRLREQQGRYALVDGIPYDMPINARNSPALMAMFTTNLDKARRLIPGNEVHPMRLWGDKGLLIITVVDYRDTDIGKYVEFSIAIACTHGNRPALPLLPGLLMGLYGTGQYVYDLPVSSEISVKGGKGIWGMPKHQANLNFIIGKRIVSSQYDLDGQLAMKIEIKRPKRAWLPVNMGAINYCQFRGMLMKSRVYFKTRVGFSFFRKGSAKLTIGTHPRLAPLKDLEIAKDPIAVFFFPSVTGLLDDYVESWFLSYEQPPREKPEGLESVVNLGLSQEWLDPPKEQHGGSNGRTPDSREVYELPNSDEKLRVGP